VAQLVDHLDVVVGAHVAHRVGRVDAGEELAVHVQDRREQLGGRHRGLGVEQGVVLGRGGGDAVQLLAGTGIGPARDLLDPVARLPLAHHRQVAQVDVHGTGARAGADLRPPHHGPALLVHRHVLAGGGSGRHQAHHG
jgi:hypothetical protein